MSNFESYLLDIANDLRSPNNDEDWNDFCAVRDHVINRLCMASPYFERLYQGSIVFGSKGHDIRLHDDDEFDVQLELCFPGYEFIQEVPDSCRPGYIFLDFEEACYDNMVSKNLAENENRFLSQCRLKSWLNVTFINAILNYAKTVEGEYEDYDLSYKYRGVAYTITAESESRTFTIDFIPAVKIERPNSHTWMAVPKFSSVKGPFNHYTFMLSNAQAELNHIERCGQPLKDVLVLLQGLRNAKNLPKVRCIHLVSLAISMIRSKGYYEINNLSLDELFIHLLWDLVNAFQNGHLPGIWDSQLNLLNNFSANEMAYYASELCKAYKTLSSYWHQPNLSFERCQEHFE